jgi:hypothetical protein
MLQELITKDDLEEFRRSLLTEIKLIVRPGSDYSNVEWLRCSDVKKMLKISTGTIQKLRISGKLKSSRVGGIHFYKRSDIENMIVGKDK